MIELYKDMELCSNISSFIAPILKEKYAIEILELAFLKEEQVEIKVNHFIHDGIYVREIFMPKGTLAIGKEHTHSFIETVSIGKVLMFLDDSEKIIEAPFTRVANAGLKKFGYVLEDTLWTTYHKTTCNTVDDAEKEFITDINYFIKESKEDYEKLLIELNINEHDVEKDMDSFELLNVNIDNEFIYKDKSNIEGYGYFSKTMIEKDSIIGVAFYNNKKTDIGRFINHSNMPNVEIISKDDNIFIKAKRNIMKNEEILLNYRDNLIKDTICQQ